MLKLDKDLKLMDGEELLKVELMKVLGIAKYGKAFNPNDPITEYDFRKGSNFERFASTILDNFVIREKSAHEKGYLDATNAGEIKGSEVIQEQKIEDKVTKEKMEEPEQVEPLDPDLQELKENEDLLEEDLNGYQRQHKNLATKKGKKNVS